MPAGMREARRDQGCSLASSEFREAMTSLASTSYSGISYCSPPNYNIITNSPPTGRRCLDGEKLFITSPWQIKSGWIGDHPKTYDLK